MCLWETTEFAEGRLSLRVETGFHGQTKSIVRTAIQVMPQVCGIPYIL